LVGHGAVGRQRGKTRSITGERDVLREMYYRIVLARWETRDTSRERLYSDFGRPANRDAAEKEWNGEGE
jgi:hypothetical protein